MAGTLAISGGLGSESASLADSDSPADCTHDDITDHWHASDSMIFNMIRTRRAAGLTEADSDLNDSGTSEVPSQVELFKFF
jgi:hypothetical protein